MAIQEFDSDGNPITPLGASARATVQAAGYHQARSIGQNAQALGSTLRTATGDVNAPQNLPPPAPVDPTVNTAGINAAAQPGTDAVKTALANVSDPSRFAAADQARGLQAGVAGYAGQLQSGQSPYVTALQRQQGLASGMGAIASTALSNQGGMAPGLVQRNAQQAQAGLAASVDSGAQMQDTAALRSAMDASGAAANGMRTQDVSQTLGSGAQQLTGAGLVATAGQHSADRTLAGAQADQGAYYAMRGQDIQAGDQSAAREQAAGQWQQTNDANNNWWMRYGLPSLSAGATAGAGALQLASSGSSTPQQGGNYVDPYAAGNGGSMYTPSNTGPTYGGQQPYAAGYDTRDV